MCRARAVSWWQPPGHGQCARSRQQVGTLGLGEAPQAQRVGSLLDGACGGGMASRAASFVLFAAHLSQAHRSLRRTPFST